jgi:hypothetical protein
MEFVLAMTKLKKLLIWRLAIAMDIASQIWSHQQDTIKR